MSPGKQQLTDIDSESFFDQSQTIPVIEEKLVVTCENVETGRILVSKRVLEEEATWNGIATSEELTVERKEINQYVQTAPAAVRQEGDVTIVSVVKEVLVVEKRLMLVEELHITRHHHHQQQTFTEVLRKEEVSVSRDGLA